MDKKVNQKLSFNKDTVTRLNAKSMSKILGGLNEPAGEDPSGTIGNDAACSSTKDIDSKTCCNSKGSKPYTS
ncbi:class I lanthipeptide [Pedobacter miscanthi]|uniref:class I lanthipeptide n=1 Tax=Pedobacter miscanthi TaxID=2259170 RepID=UPI00292F3257|nr:class I lanthipeptide [Pedobacter miscanthi]